MQIYTTAVVGTGRRMDVYVDGAFVGVLHHSSPIGPNCDSAREALVLASMTPEPHLVESFLIREWLGHIDTLSTRSTTRLVRSGDCLPVRLL